MVLDSLDRRIIDWISIWLAKNGAWPTFHDLERAFVSERHPNFQLKIQELLFRAESYSISSREQSMILPRNLWLRASNLEVAFTPVVDALSLIVGEFIDSKSAPVFTNSVCLEAGWSKDETEFLGKLISSIRPSFVGSSGHSRDFQEWHFQILPSILEFESVGSGRQFLMVERRVRRAQNFDGGRFKWAFLKWMSKRRFWSIGGALLMGISIAVLSAVIVNFFIG